MKRSVTVFSLAFAMSVSCAKGAPTSTTAQEIAAQELGLIPEPLSVQAFAATYTVAAKSSVRTSGSDSQNAVLFLEAFLEQRGITVSDPAATEPAAIQLSTDANDPTIGSEGYHLIVASSGIMISANTGQGLFYGLQTLEQMFPPTHAGPATIHQAQITDKPEYPWRGIMLDVSRHYFPVPFVEQLIDVAASYKLNTFHWHLVDDEGWRIQIRKYPRLTQVGSCGDHDHPLGSAPCRFYTQQDIRDIVAYAKKRYVTIVPEIEVPGHSAAALAAYPELACKPIASNVYCPSQQTFRFLENVMNEVMGLFPSSDIHIGGDEVSPKAWDASPLAQSVMQQNHLSDAHALQAWMDQRIEEYLARHGRRTTEWDEVLAGGVSKNVIVMGWRGTNGGILAAAHGNDAVMAPGTWMYFNRYEGPSAWEPLGANQIDTLHDVYAYGPDLRSLSAEERGHILGVEGCLWTEFVPTTNVAWFRLFPRLLALSEMAWTAPAQKNWNSFQQRTINQYPRLEARGISFYIPGPNELKDTVTEAQHLAVTLTSPVPDSTMYYTLDGSYPTPSAKQYSAPISINLNPGDEVRLRVVTVLANGRTSTPAEASYIRRWKNLTKDN